MGQLHSGGAGLFMDEPNDSAQRLDMFISPNAKILRTDPRLGKNSRRLRHNQPRATDRAAPEMNEMPVVSVTVAARVLAHRRHEYPIGKLYVSNPERIKQSGHQLSDITRHKSLVTQLPRRSLVQSRAVAQRLLDEDGPPM